MDSRPAGINRLQRSALFAIATLSAAVLIVTPAMLGFIFSVVVAVAWCIWLDDRPAPPAV